MSKPKKPTKIKTLKSLAWRGWSKRMAKSLKHMDDDDAILLRHYSNGFADGYAHACRELPLPKKGGKRK